MEKATKNNFVVLQRDDFAKICRCCLAMNPTSSIFEVQFEQKLIFEILQCLFCSEIKVDDDLPKNICQNCIGEVVRFYCFKRSYDLTEAMLLRILVKSEEEKQYDDQTSVIKSEISFEEHVLKSEGEEIEIQVNQPINNFENVQGESRETEHVNNSIIVEDCEEEELKFKPPVDTEIKCGESLNGFVCLLQKNQNTNFPNPVTDDDTKKINKPVNSEESQIINILNLETKVCFNKSVVLNDLTQHNEIKDIQNPETGVKEKDAPCNKRCVEVKSAEMVTCSCLEVFGTKSEYHIHRREQKEQHRMKYPCEICKKYFPRSRLLVHMRSHTKEKPYTCDICSQSFSSFSNLDRHKRIHSGEKPYVCEYCKRAFTQSTALINHRRIHTKEKPFLCESCGKSFGNIQVFYKHNKKHVEKDTNLPNKPRNKADKKPLSCDQKFLCRFCGKQFTSKQSLDKHNLLKHKNKRTFLCTYCGKGFANNGSLQIHTYIHTGEKRYSCTYCDKTFSQSVALKVHTYTHTGEKPHVCRICQKGFVQAQHLKSHLRTHNGEKPFECKLCGKASAHQTTHIVHMRTHTGEKPYVCDGCQKGFFHSSSMKKHRKKYCKGVPAKDT